MRARGVAGEEHVPRIAPVGFDIGHHPGQCAGDVANLGRMLAVIAKSIRAHYGHVAALTECAAHERPSIELMFAVAAHPASSSGTVSADCAYVFRTMNVEDNRPQCCRRFKVRRVEDVKLVLVKMRVYAVIVGNVEQRGRCAVHERLGLHGGHGGGGQTEECHGEVYTSFK